MSLNFSIQPGHGDKGRTSRDARKRGVEDISSTVCTV